MKIQKPIICCPTNNPESLPRPSMTNHLLHLFTNFKVIQLGIDAHFPCRKMSITITPVFVLKVLSPVAMQLKIASNRPMLIFWERISLESSSRDKKKVPTLLTFFHIIMAYYIVGHDIMYRKN